VSSKRVSENKRKNYCPFERGTGQKRKAPFPFGGKRISRRWRGKVFEKKEDRTYSIFEGGGGPFLVGKEKEESP